MALGACLQEERAMVWTDQHKATSPVETIIGFAFLETIWAYLGGRDRKEVFSKYFRVEYRALDTSNRGMYPFLRRLKIRSKTVQRELVERFFLKL
jgi:hypothetical protein